MIIDDFMIRAIIAGIGVSIAAAPIGCFVVWRNLAYFGDATAHAAILGVSLALLFELSVFVGVFGVALAMALTVSTVGQRFLGSNTVLGVASQTALAVGIVAFSLAADSRVDLDAYLFGEILAVSNSDILVIWIGSAAIVFFVASRWTALLLSTFNPEIAQASGLHPHREQLYMNVALAALVAVAIKVVGALLVTAMLIIPAAGARPISKSPEGMAAAAVAIASGSVLAGLWISNLVNSPAGPTIIVAAAVAFLVSMLLSAARNREI